MRRYVLVLMIASVLLLFSTSLVWASISLSPRTDLGGFTSDIISDSTGEISTGDGTYVHDTEVTRRWYDQYHAMYLTEEWVAKSHALELTQEWENKGHWLHTSQEWTEKDHNIDLSLEWLKRLHFVDLTKEWVSQDHTLNLTLQWGSAHKVHWTREGHDTATSWQWYRDDHDENVSKRWAKEGHHYPWSLEGHETALSEKWLDEHDKKLSQKWSLDGHWFVWTIEEHDTDLSWQWNRDRHRYGQSKLEQNKAAELPELVRSMQLPRGTEQSLLAKANSAVASLERGNFDTAANQLQAFINEVKAQDSKKISEQDAAMLVESAQRVIIVLGDGNGNSWADMGSIKQQR